MHQKLLQTWEKRSHEAELLSIWAPLLEAGLSVTDSVRLLSQSAEHAADRRGFVRVLQGLGRGLSLSRAVKDAELGVSQGLIAALANAERSGTIGQLLSLSATRSQERRAMSQKAWSAARYPLVVALLGSLIIVGLVVSIVPRFQALYDRMGSELPVATEVLIGLAHLLTTHGLFIGVLLIGCTVGFRLWLQSPSGRLLADHALSHLPIIGSLRRSLQTQALCGHLELLITAGVGLPEALDASARAVAAPVLSQSLHQQAQHIRTGLRTERALDAVPIAVETIHLWRLGVQTGRLPEFLNIANHSLHNRLHHQLSALISLLEPLMMATLGVVTGAVMLALYQPIFALGDAL